MMVKLVLTIACLLINGLLNVNAQSGPELPCPSCNQNFIKPTPYEGSWFNPEQSGSGFLIDIQNHILVGYYFGYQENGDAQWSLFTGELQDASDENALWKVSAPLQSFRDGGCLNCEYRPPSADNNLGQIEIVFNRLTHATFSVDGGASQNIVPIYFGYALNNYSQQSPAFYSPELEGWWIVYINLKELPDWLTDPWSYRSYIAYLGKGRVSGDGKLSYFSTTLASPPEVLRLGDIICNRQVVPNETQCNLNSALFGYFEIDFANISPNRIYGESEIGDTIELLRLNSDFCFSNDPDDCVNTQFQD